MLQFNAIKDYCIFKDFFWYTYVRYHNPDIDSLIKLVSSLYLLRDDRENGKVENIEYLEERTTVNYD